VGQPSFITAPNVARPYGHFRSDYPTPRDHAVDTFIRRNDRHFGGEFDDLPIELRTVKDVERENDGDILDELEDVILH
jgi:hypothetical protein